jgi:hypothetical protein
MDLLYSIFFGAGIAGFTYTKIGRRIGFGNAQMVWVVTGVAFLLSFIFFFTVMKFIVNV